MLSGYTHCIQHVSGKILGGVEDGEGLGVGGCLFLVLGFFKECLVKRDLEDVA